MKEKWPYLAKVACSMIIILILPLLFFQYIGQNPMKVHENATGAIAVVNEDLGADKGIGDPVRFGEDIVPVLDNNSNYTWTVTGRSAAVNGLKNLQYDAVVYIPSHFSQNILTYDEKHPEKATLKYQVQDQLNAVNKEKVQKELNQATHKVDSHISSLYWSYISQEMKHVRKQFGDILDKEIAFQDAMISFYSPSSKDLTDEFAQQKQLLKELKSNINDAEKGSSERKEDVGQIEDKLTNFVDYVQAYKTYQQKQKEILQKVQGESENQITQGLKTIEDKQSQLGDTFQNQINPLTNGITTIQQAIAQNNQAMNDLGQARAAHPEEQKNQLTPYFVGLVNEYKQQYDQNRFQTQNGNLVDLEGKMGDALKGDEDPNPGDPPPDGNEPGGDHPAVDIQNPPVNTHDEQGKLTEINNGIHELRDKLNGLPTDQLPPEISEKIQDSLKKLDDLSTSIGNVNEALQGKDDKIKEQYTSLVNQIQKLSDQIKNDSGLKDEIDRLKERIKELEEGNGKDKGYIIDKIENEKKSIEDSGNLPSERQEGLDRIFNNNDLHRKSMEQLITVNGYLSQYLQTVKDMGTVESPGATTILEQNQEQMDHILSDSDVEKNAWNNLQSGLTDTKGGLEEFKKSTQDFVSGYNDYIGKQQTAMMDNIDAISESANQVNQKMQQPDDFDAQHEDSNQAPDGTMLLSLQKGMGQELQNMNQLMGSLGERQKNIVDYTGQLQHKVDSVQDKADTLNNKWSKNVSATKKVNENANNILGNTNVDGQDNGYVYNYLANPLQISGDVPADKEKTVPPVVVMVIILISSLLIGYFSHYYREAPLLVKGSLFGLLNLIVGLMISLLSLNIYSLQSDRAIQWTIFTILLLVAASTLVRVAFWLGSLIGWFVSAGLILFFVTPLLNLAMPNFRYHDPVSEVYMSIQYDTNSLFVEGAIVLVGIILVLTAIPFVAHLFKSNIEEESEQAHEA